MRLLELKIQNVRGIKELSLSLDGKNCVIWGPNGSGKSAVVDAIDFLLTGRISRLMGEGTAGVSLGRHGPHIDYKPEDAVVTARIEILSYPEPFTLRRKMSAPKVLEYPDSAKQAFQPILDLASCGQHVLSRRDILKYVAAEAGKRAQEVQELLNLSQLEDFRRCFGRVLRNARGEVTTASSSLMSAQEWIKNTLRLNVFEKEAVLKKVNELRSVLGGEPLQDVKSIGLKADLSAPSAGAGTRPQLNSELLGKDLKALIGILESAQNNVAGPDKQLRTLLHAVRENELARRELVRLKLLEMGVSLIDESGACPLCDTPWPPGELKKKLEKKIADAKSIKEKETKIYSVAASISATVDTCRSYVERIRDAATHLGMTRQAAELSGWEQGLRSLANDLKTALDNYPRKEQDESKVRSLLAPADAREIAKQVISEAESKTPRASPESTAWDTLTRLEENWKQYEAAEAKHKVAGRFLRQADVLDQSFDAARDGVLASLYEEIKSRFTKLYRMIHSEDESGFETSLRPEGASLHLEVDFYRRGKHPPLALHSEGHQDTMGFVLYLALAERLTSGLIGLTILDDVVMSVDSAHRRQICKMLGKEFPDRQFLITTHDRTWARELEIEGVVSRQNVVEFARWSIDTGPFVSMEADLWSKIDKDIQSGDIPAAAARLRRGMEHHFEAVSHSLQACVRYRSDGRWELSDFVDAAIGKYKNLLRAAKASAQSWKNFDLLEKLTEQETVAQQVITRSHAEQWSVNANVHYNRWVEFSAADFLPVFEAMRDLAALFKCGQCGGVFVLTAAGLEPSAVRCRCGKVNWNLLKKTAT